MKSIKRFAPQAELGLRGQNVILLYNNFEWLESESLGCEGNKNVNFARKQLLLFDTFGFEVLNTYVI